jgi:hypothetical protein
VLLEPLDGFLNIHLFIPAQFQGIIDLPVSIVDRHHVVREALAFGAGNVPLAEQRKGLAEFLSVGIIDKQDRRLLGSCRRVFTQQFQAALIDRSHRPRVLGEKTVEAALVLDLNPKRPIDRLNGFVLANKQTPQVASKMLKLLWAKS